MRTIRYYAYAATPEKTRIGLLLVIRENGRQVARSWTGRYWPNTRSGADAAARRCGTLNAGLTVELEDSTEMQITIVAR